MPRHPRGARHPARGPLARGTEVALRRHGLLLGRRADLLAAARRRDDRGRLPGRLHARTRPTRRPAPAAPATPRPCSSPTTRPGHLARAAAQGVLGEPRPHPGHTGRATTSAPQYRSAIYWTTTRRRPRRAPRGPPSSTLLDRRRARRDHHRRSARGRGRTVLLRRGLPPAVPAQEPRTATAASAARASRAPSVWSRPTAEHDDLRHGRGVAHGGAPRRRAGGPRGDHDVPTGRHARLGQRRSAPRRHLARQDRPHGRVEVSPVAGPRRVRRLNLDGDGQGDLAGHGGEQRAALVYQTDSYRYWAGELGRSDLAPGHFGENLTVDGLPDDEVCIGDRYRIGSAVFEVTQPRVTCYRVGLRLGEPRMPALLVARRRPGFYLRVLEEGEVSAGDEIILVAAGPERMSVAEVDGLLYLPGHGRDDVARALRIPALSPGWQASFAAILDDGSTPGGGNAGLVDTAPPPAWPGFRPFRVTARQAESRTRDVPGPGAGRRFAGTAGAPGTVRHPPAAARAPRRRRCCGATRCRARRATRGTASASSASRVARAAGTCTTVCGSATWSTSRRRAGTSPCAPGRRRSSWSARGSAPLPSSPCCTRWPARAPTGRSGGCTARATGPSSPSRPRPTRCSRGCRTPTATSPTAAPTPATGRAATSTAWAGCRRRRSPLSTCRATRTPTCAAPPASCATSPPRWSPSASIPPTSTPRSSGPGPRSRRASRRPPRVRRTRRPPTPGPGRRWPSPAVA